MKRLSDVITAAALLVALLPAMACIALAIKLTSRGPVLHLSRRVGRRNAIFLMPKFRTMRVGTPQVATHLLSDPSTHITRVGAFLRRTSLDELPQVWSIFVGEMSFVGPRPALFNQHDLTALRTAAGIDFLRPGLTGWAQVNGRDELSIEAKVAYEIEYARRRSLWFDARILAMTLRQAFVGMGVAEGVRRSANERRAA